MPFCIHCKKQCSAFNGEVKNVRNRYLLTCNCRLCNSRCGKYQQRIYVFNR